MSASAARSAATIVARLECDEATAWRLADLLAERFDPAETATTIVAGKGGRWIVELNLGAASDRDAARDVVAQVAGADAARALTFDIVTAKDWVAASLEGLAPVEAGRFVVHGRHDRANIPVNRIGIEIEAALAFGTGHHGTTRGCLLALDRILKARRPVRILDVGTGTGVLGIAAARALRRRVLASDLDPRAVVVARDNSRANGVGAMLEAIAARGLTGRQFRERAPFDLVLANILLAPLKRLAAPMAPLVAPNARVVLSGLLAAHANAALAAYCACGLALESRIRLDGWVTLVLVRRRRRRTIVRAKRLSG